MKQPKYDLLQQFILKFNSFWLISSIKTMECATIGCRFESPEAKTYEISRHIWTYSSTLFQLVILLQMYKDSLDQISWPRIGQIVGKEMDYFQQDICKHNTSLVHQVQWQVYLIFNEQICIRMTASSVYENYKYTQYFTDKSKFV